MVEFKKLFESTSWKPNDLETERVFRETCTQYESQCSASGQLPSQDYQDYVNFYHQCTSIYLTVEEPNNKTKLIIYDTESETEEIKILDTQNGLDAFSCITQIPNGELFCYGKWNPNSGITLIIDRNYRVRTLPSGIKTHNGSCIYLNNNVYCFGGGDYMNKCRFTRKFDLNENRWIMLTQMPKEEAFCYSMAFNGNILVSGSCQNLFLYSVDINSFSVIPYKFDSYCRKLMINVEKLYVIECSFNGWIYESDNEYDWNKISKSEIGHYNNQIYCSYNKGAIYISKRLNPKYFKFDLAQKIMIKLQ